MFSGHGFLLRRRRRKTSSVCEDLVVSSAPHKWPGNYFLNFFWEFCYVNFFTLILFLFLVLGAENLLAYLSRERDEDVPNLLLLLAESWVAVYLALFTYAFSAYDSRWLYRLVGHSINSTMFSLIFGGGAEKKMPLGMGTTQEEAPPASNYGPPQR